MPTVFDLNSKYSGHLVSGGRPEKHTNRAIFQKGRRRLLRLSRTLFAVRPRQAKLTLLKLHGAAPMTAHKPERNSL